MTSQQALAIKDAQKIPTIQNFMPRIVNKKPKYRTENRYLEMKKIKIIYTLEFCRR